MKRERNLLLVKVHEKKKKPLKQTKELETESFPEKIFQNTESKSKNLEG